MEEYQLNQRPPARIVVRSPSPVTLEASGDCLLHSLVVEGDADVRCGPTGFFNAPGRRVDVGGDLNLFADSNISTVHLGTSAFYAFPRDTVGKRPSR